MQSLLLFTSNRKNFIYWGTVGLARQAQKCEVSCGFSTIFSLGMKSPFRRCLKSENFWCLTGSYSFWWCWLPNAVYNHIPFPFTVYQSESHGRLSLWSMLAIDFLISSY